MKSKAVLGLLLGLLLVRAVSAQSFHLDIQAPAELRPDESFWAEFALTSSGIDPGQTGVQAWNLSVAHERLEILEVSVQGTAVELFGRADAFQVHEITTGADNAGFIAVVLLSFSDPTVTLPSTGSQVLVKARYRLLPEACRGSAAIRLKNGLIGAGRPINNLVITFPAATFNLGEGDSTPWTVESCLQPQYLLHAGLAPNFQGVPFREVRKIPVEIRLSQDKEVASAWNLAVRHDSRELAILEASLLGSPAAGLLGTEGFQLFEITSGAGNSGFVAQVVLSSNPLQVLPGDDGVVATASYRLLSSVEESDIGGVKTVTLKFPSLGLSGSGGTVKNRVEPEGALAAADAALVIPILPPQPFVRGEVVSDGGLDLADPVRLLFYLFLGESVDCREAADWNNDLSLDISDVIGLLQYLFLRGSPPAAPPFPECGPDPEPVGLGCERSICG